MVDNLEDIERFEAVETELGIELRMWLNDWMPRALPTGAGSMPDPLAADFAASRAWPRRCGHRCPSAPQGIHLRRDHGGGHFHGAGANLNHETARGARRRLLGAGRGLVALREESAGITRSTSFAGARRGGENARDGLIVLTSRISVEMVQKAASAGAPILVACRRRPRLPSRWPSSVA